MEVRTGTVISAETGRAMVRMDREDMDCGGCRSCALKSLCHGRESSHIDVLVAVPEGRRLEAGEKVQIAYEAANAAKAAAILFSPTLIGLLSGGWLGGVLFGEGDGVFLAGAAAGVCAGLAVTYCIERMSRSSSPKIRLIGPASGE